MPINYPKVDRAAVEGFLKVYNRGAIYVLFDDKSKQAMVDFANVALKSYVDDLQLKAQKMMADAMAKSKAQPQTPDPEPASKSSIVLTD